MTRRSKTATATLSAILVALFGVWALTSGASDGPASSPAASPANSPTEDPAATTSATSVQKKLKEAKKKAASLCRKSKKLSQSNQAGGGEKAKAKRRCGKARKRVKHLRKRLPVRIKASGSAFGKMLFDRNNQAIYIFQKERSKTAKCYGACASAWPPVLTSDKPTALKGVKRSLLGTTKRKGGAKQATYAGHPLYYYAHEGPGEVLCHNVVSFGGNWKVIHGSGKPAD